jgi:Fur family ferric uptake transcriptional regulator
VTLNTRDDFAAALREGGSRVTAPRLAVLLVVTEGKHMTPEQIALAARERVGAISTQAVYDVLGCPDRQTHPQTPDKERGG